MRLDPCSAAEASCVSTHFALNLVVDCRSEESGVKVPPAKTLLRGGHKSRALGDYASIFETLLWGEQVEVGILALARLEKALLVPFGHVVVFSGGGI